MSQKKIYFNILIQDKSIGRFVVILTSILSFLACFALLFLLNTQRQYQDWQKILNQTFFVEFMPESKKEDDLNTLNTTLQFLQNAKGVLSVRVIPEEEAKALLKPWLGEDESNFKRYKLPVVIDVTTNLSLEDLEHLERSLKQQSPQVNITARDAWTGQLSDYSMALKILAIVVFTLILLGLGIIILTASKMSVVLQSQYVDLLKLMGASYRFISKQFERFFTIKVIKGSLLGMIVATSLFHSFLVLQDGKLVLMKHFLIYEDVFYLFLIPLFLLLLSYFVSRITTSHFLRVGY
jgi:cell division transport system permease protein